MNKTAVKAAAIGSLATSLLLGAAACSGKNNANSDEQATQTSQQDIYNRVQPNPLFQYSVLRNTLQEVERAETSGSATTSFFWNMGLDHPLSSCPSLGFPVPSTAQLSNPSQGFWSGDKGGSMVLPQQEPTGIYTGDSSGTYVVCVAPNGSTYISYWEGPVQTVSGPAHFDEGSKQVVLDGPSSVTVKTK